MQPHFGWSSVGQELHPLRQEVQDPLHADGAEGELQVWWTSSLSIDEGTGGMAGYSRTLVSGEDCSGFHSGTTAVEPSCALTAGHAL